MKRCALFLIFLFHFFAVYSQENKGFKLIVTLENSPFESLWLFDYTEGRNVLIAADKIDKYSWKIDIPEQIAQTSEHMQLIVNPYDSLSNAIQSVRFVRKSADGEIVNANVGIDSNINYINGYYKGQQIIKDEWIARTINGKDSLILGDLILEDFYLNDSNSSDDIVVRSMQPTFAWFVSNTGKEETYEELLSSYVTLSKKYPHSIFLLRNLAENLANFKSIGDVKQIFNHLSDTHKDTQWYARIERFIKNKFTNMALLNVENGLHENVVMDSTIFNLLIFTASYCVPCIEEIPILQEMYSDLKGKVAFTYVSIDKQSSINSFQKIVKDHMIPWRTLYALDHHKEVKDKFYINHIPFNILITPAGEIEILDVRVKEHRDKIYKIVNSGI